MDYNINTSNKILNNADYNNEVQENKLTKIPCIWDADNDKKFSTNDVVEYLNKNYSDLDNNQKNKVITMLKKELSQKILYTKINVIFLTQKIVNAIKCVKSQQVSATNNIHNSVSEFIKKKEQNSKRILVLAKLHGYKSNLSVINQQIKNQYYTGGLYDIKFSGLNITIINHSTGKKHQIDLYLLLDSMSDKEIVNFLLFIQKQPAEVLEDLSIEMEDLLSPTGRNMHTMDNQEFIAGGYYKPSNDSIVTSPVHLVHELGHAIDFSGKVNKASTTNNKKFMATFRKELNNYKKMGNVQYNYNDKNTWKKGNEYNYCTANEKELFAESYQLAMTGDCRSKNVIMKYFPETFKIVLEILKETRQKSDLDRRYTPQREMINSITNALS